MAKKIETELKTSIEKHSVDILTVITKFLKSKNIISKSTSDITFDFKNDSAIIELPSNWRYIERGRLKGSYPPIKPIVNWITEKKIQIPSGITKLQLAYAISTSIYKSGVKPRPFISELTNLISDSIGLQYTKLINNKLQKTLITKK